MAAVTIGTVLAGCTSGGSGTEEPPETTAGEVEANDETFDGWLSGVDGADRLTDATGRSEVRVRVGAEGNGGNFAFDPAVLRVSTGTTVVWEWTGLGSAHNVVDEAGAFQSGLSGTEGTTFSHTFETAGVTKYACTPHESIGMKGVVVVD
ncbi:halocyanin domain-containing protein [Halogeometricum limi]|uniref:Halocyanin domain-containing protein n=2 Tax=Halogeometricum limi TaxID=555875 RepID=A0A1I6IAC9_9EURY|nr:halocyanin domain-containing protein [Halogeometricum limi]